MTGSEKPNSSKDKFLDWMVEELEIQRARFEWSDEEVEAIAGLLITAATPRSARPDAWSALQHLSAQ